MRKNTLVSKNDNERLYVKKTLLSMIKEGKITRAEIARAAETNGAAITRFLGKGNSRLNDNAIENIYSKNILPRFEIKEVQLIAPENTPLDNWLGDVMSIPEVIEIKGYSRGTIKKYYMNGTLNYVVQGKRVFIAIDEKFSNLCPTRLIQLQNRVLELENKVKSQEIEISSLKEKQSKFNFTKFEEMEEKIKEKDDKIEDLEEEIKELEEKLSFHEEKEYSDLESQHDDVEDVDVEDNSLPVYSKQGFFENDFLNS